MKGKLVVCDWLTSGTEASIAGAVGTIMQGDDFRDVARNSPIPASYLNSTDGSEVETYLNSTRYMYTISYLFYCTFVHSESIIGYDI